MNNKDKHYLKALLLASMSSIGITASHAAGASTIAARKEREGSDTNIEMVSEALSSGVLESHPSFGEVLGHTSHSSHSSHGSHTSSSHGSHSSHTSSSHTSHTSHTSSSHTSHTSSSGYGNGGSGYGNGSYGGGTYGGSTHSGSSAEVKGLLIGTGAVLAGVGVYALVKHIIKTHKKHVDARRTDINRHRAFASRELSSGMYGTDVDRMTDLLIENDVLDGFDRTLSSKWIHYKYDRKVKHSVKRMQARMGWKRTGKAPKSFQMNLQQWKNTRNRFIVAASKDSLDLTQDRNALMAVAILLVEKGYLKDYDTDNITSEHEKSKIIKAYKNFLRRNQLPETTLVDEQRLRLLESLPNNQK